MVNNDTMTPVGSELTYLPDAPIKETTYDSKTGMQVSQKEVSCEEIDGRNLESARKILNRPLMYLQMSFEFIDALMLVLIKGIMSDKWPNINDY